MSVCIYVAVNMSVFECVGLGGGGDIFIDFLRILYKKGLQNCLCQLLLLYVSIHT